MGLTYPQTLPDVSGGFYPIGSGGTAPAVLPGGIPVAYWDASDIQLTDGSAVTTWTDRIAGIAMTQATPVNQPVFRSKGVGNLPAVEFQGNQNLGTLAGLLLLDPQNFSIIMFGRFENPQGQCDLFRLGFGLFTGYTMTQGCPTLGSNTKCVYNNLVYTLNGHSAATPALVVVPGEDHVLTLSSGASPTYTVNDAFCTASVATQTVTYASTGLGFSSFSTPNTILTSSAIANGAPSFTPAVNGQWLVITAGSGWNTGVYLMSNGNTGANTVQVGVSINGGVSPTGGSTPGGNGTFGIATNNDLAVVSSGASSTVTSASWNSGAGFTSADVGKVIVVMFGTNFNVGSTTVPTSYPITSVTGGVATITGAIASSGTPTGGYFAVSNFRYDGIKVGDTSNPFQAKVTQIYVFPRNLTQSTEVVSSTRFLMNYAGSTRLKDVDAPAFTFGGDSLIYCATATNTATTHPAVFQQGAGGPRALSITNFAKGGGTPTTMTADLPRVNVMNSPSRAWNGHIWQCGGNNVSNALTGAGSFTTLIQTYAAAVQALSQKPQYNWVCTNPDNGIGYTGVGSSLRAFQAAERALAPGTVATPWCDAILDIALHPQLGYPGVQDIWTITPPVSGNFQVTFNSSPSGNIAFNATSATAQTTLQALGTIGAGNISVTGGSGQPFVCIFGGTFLTNPQTGFTVSAGSVVHTQTGVTGTASHTKSVYFNDPHLTTAGYAMYGKEEIGRARLILNGRGTPLPGQERVPGGFSCYTMALNGTTPGAGVDLVPAMSIPLSAGPAFMNGGITGGSGQFWDLEVRCQVSSLDTNANLGYIKKRRQVQITGPSPGSVAFTTIEADDITYTPLSGGLTSATFNIVASTIYVAGAPTGLVCGIDIIPVGEAKNLSWAFTASLYRSIF